MHTLAKAETKNQDINHRREIELLLYCARTQGGNLTSEQIKALVREGIDWKYLLAIAVRHRVTPLLYWNLKNTCPELLPDEQFKILAKYFQANSCRNLLLTQELIKVLHLFKAHNIPVLSFKGPLLAASVYRNLSLREISDLDFLVHPEDFQKAADLLITQGYKCWLEAKVRWECHLIKEDGIHNIDLHSEIVPKHLSCSISENYYWENTNLFSIAGSKILNLSPEAYFFLLCLNGNKECWRSLNRICDVAEVISTYPQLNWTQIFEQANRLGCKRLISLSLLLAGDLLKAPIPAQVWEQVQLDTGAKLLFMSVSKQLFAENRERVLEVHRTLFHIKTRERLQDKVSIFIDLMNYSGWLTPTEKDLNFVKLPTFLYFLYYIIRPIRVLVKYQYTLLKFIKK